MTSTPIYSSLVSQKQAEITSTQQSQKRFDALDGLRGLAILLVIINHVPVDFLYRQVPHFFSPILDILTLNGKTGVSILFLLTGFLMSRLYPQPRSYWAFLSRRYARLFPPFWVLVTSIAIIRFLQMEWGETPWFFELGVLIGMALVGRGIWEGITFVCSQLESSSIKDWRLAQAFPVSIVLLQMLTALWYIFFLLRVPPAIFYNEWSKLSQLFITWWVNATLTLPFGQYIPQLDGVYWSLVTEVIFYLIYPIFFVPIIALVNSRFSARWKKLVLITTLPFSFTLQYIAERILGMSLIIPYFFVYFIWGTVMGTHFDFAQTQLKNLPKSLVGKAAQSILLLAILSHVVVYPFLAHALHAWVQIFLVIPICFLLLLLTSPSAQLSKGTWFTTRWLKFIGGISYSLYLTHSLVIEWYSRSFVFTTWFEFSTYVILIFLTSILLSYFLFKVIEQPYFSLRKSRLQASFKSELIKKEKTTKHWQTQRLIFLSIMLGLLYIAHRPPFALFTFVEKENTDSEQITLSNGLSSQVALPILADHNNLGMISLHLSQEKQRGSFQRSTDTQTAKEPSCQLGISLKSYDTGEVLAQSSVLLHEVGESRYHPFGFAVIPESVGKKYVLVLNTESVDPACGARMNTQEGALYAVYFPPRSEVLKDSALFIRWSIAKLSEPLQQHSFWRTLGLMSPFLLLITSSMIPRKRLVLKHTTAK